ncbi:flagellar basal body rod protein FlgB [Desulfomarina sp.]
MQLNDFIFFYMERIMDPVKPFDSQMALLKKVLDLRADKAQVISSNIANAETPGYSRAVFDFEDELNNAIHRGKNIDLATSSEKHITLAPANFASVVGKIRHVSDKTGIGDQNGVNVAQEMIDLSENEIMYETSAQLLKKKLNLLKYVISGGQ